MPELQQPRATELARRDVLGDLNNLLGLLSNPVDSVGKKVDSLNTGNDDTQSSAAVIPVGDDQSSIAQLSSANRDFDQSFGNFMNGVQQTGDGLGRAVVSILEPVLAPLAAVIPLAGISNFDASASGSDESINFRHGSHFDENADPDISSSGVSSKQASIPSDQITNSNTNNDNGITGGDIASGTFPTIQVSDPAAANTTEPQSTTPANSNVAQPQSTLNGDGIAASLDGTQTNGSSTSSGQTAGIAIVPVKAGDQTGIAIIPVDSSSPQITAQVSANPQVGDGFISTATSDPTIAASPADGTSTNTDSANTQSVSNTTTSPTFPDGQHLVDKTPMGSGYLAPGIADALNATAINPAGIRIDGVSDIDNSVSS